MEQEDRVRNELSTLCGREDGVLIEYMDYLYDDRDLARATAYNYYCLIRTLAMFIFNRRHELPCQVDETALVRVRPSDMAGVTEDEWTDFLSFVRVSLGEADTSISTRVSAIRGFYRWLEKEHGIAMPPCIAKVERPAYRPHQHITVTKEIAEDLVKAMQRHTNSERNICILWFLLDCGLSLDEICQLTIDDIEIKSIVIQANGKKPRREIPLTPDVSQAIDDYLAVRKPPIDGTKAFFVSHTKGQLKIGAVKKVIRQAANVCHGAAAGVSASDLQMTAKQNIIRGHGVDAAAELTNVATKRYMRRRFCKDAPVDVEQGGA